MKSIVFEACVDSIQSALNAKQAGVDRLELCTELSVGGLTPSAGLIKAARQIEDIALNVLIRPRSGDFCYNVEEVEVMLYNIKIAKSFGANGVVIGALTKDANLDFNNMIKLVEEAKPMSITFHRAFDLVTDPYTTLNQLIDLGIDRVLTSGQAATAFKGIDLIKELSKISEGKIIIMPGAGVSEHNIYDIVYNTGVTEIHGSGKTCIKNITYTTKNKVNMGVSDEGDSTRFEASITRLSEMIKNANKALKDKI